MQQEIGWFDCIDQSELSTNFTTDTFAFQGGIGEKVATLIQLCGVFIGGFAIAFYKGWLMTLVIVATLPLTAIAGYFYISIVQARDSKNKQFYAQAGALSEQAIYSIKTIKQLNGEQFEQIKYNSCLQEITSKAIRFAIFAAIALGAMSFSSMISYSLGFWFGSNCLEKNSSCPPNVAGISSPGDVLVVFFGVLVAGLNLSQLSPSLNKIAEGKQAAARIFKIIDRKPLIVNPLNGLKPGKFKGHIDFKSVTFAYPKDKSKTILENLSLSFTTSSTALVG